MSDPWKKSIRSMRIIRRIRSMSRSIRSTTMDKSTIMSIRSMNTTARIVI